MNVSTQSLYQQYSQLTSIEIIDISVSDWINAIDLEWPDNKDPADRLITAYAIQKQCAIVTSDKKIKAYYSNVIW